MGGIKQKYNMKAVFDNLNRKQHGTKKEVKSDLDERNALNKAIKQTTFNFKNIDKSATHQANKRSGRGS